MHVQEVHKETREKYERFVSDHGGIFNSVAWQSCVHTDNMKLYGIFEDDGQLAGVFHLYIQKYAGMSFVKNPPYIPHIGLVYNNRSVNASNALSLTKKITEQVCECVEKLSPSVTSIAFPPEVKDMQVFFWKKYKVVPNYTYRLPLSIAIDEIEKRFSPEHRNSLKKAVKENINVKFCTDYSIVKTLVSDTFSRKEKQVNMNLIDAILFKLADPENSFAYVAYAGAKPIAAAFCLHDKRTSYYLLGGYAADSKHQGAGILCVYNSIMHAQKAGLETFDFEGSMIKEVERYFRGFGPELVPYYTVNKAKLPFEFVLKFIKRQLF